MLDLSTVRERLEVIARADPSFAVFGADHHHYELGPPLALGVLARLEDQLGVRLPEEHRSFLMEVGDGGAGPGYGLTTLETAVAYLDWDQQREFEEDPTKVAVPLAAIEFP